MDFYLKIDKRKTINSFTISQSFQDSLSEDNNGFFFYLSKKDNHTTVEQITLPHSQSILIGDPIYPSIKRDHIHAFLGRDEFGNFFRAVDGFYFLIHWNKKSKQLIVGCSMFNILPVYFTETDNSLYISSSFDLIRKNSGITFTTDHQYYLEKALFHYPLFTRTPLKQIKTTPSNHFMVYDGKLSFSRHTKISDYYVENPLPWRKSLDQLSEVFIEKAKPFIPEEKFCATLTGGFDGRTIIGLALKMKKSFFTYSYGPETSLDVKVPIAVSKKLGFTHKALLIDETYSSHDFYENGEAFLSKSFGLGNMSRAHYYHALETVLKDSRYLLTGNFGSEIIRSMKVPGVMTSAMLFKLFENLGKAQLRTEILKNNGVKYLSKKLIANYIDPLLDEIFEYLDNLPKHLSTNQRFYTYLYEEVFPKYFGPEISVQRQFINHRAPFLCFRFIQALLKTGIAGANSDFKETNPFKRYHGQVLYAHILKKTTPALLDQPLDRGYKPRYFLTTMGPLQIAMGFALRKLRKRKPNSIPDYAKDNTARNISKMLKTPIANDLFDLDFFNRQFQGSWQTDQMNFANMFSAVKYESKLDEKVLHSA
jgi:hypothetical protein